MKKRRSPRKGRKAGRFVRVAEGLVRHQSSGTYYAYFRVNGKPTRKSLGTTDPVVAKNLLHEERRKAGNGVAPHDDVTLGGLADRFLEGQKKLSRSCQVRASGLMKLVLDKWPRETRVRDIRPSEIDAWLSAHKQAHDWRPATYNKYRSLMIALFAMAANDGLLYVNPAAKGTKKLRSERIRKPTPSFADFLRLVANIRDQPNNPDAEESADFVAMMGLGGVGNGEAAALRWHDILWSEDKIRVTRLKTKTSYEVPLFPHLRNFLTHLRAKKEPASGEEKIFHIKNASKAIDGACKRLGLPQYDQRAMRRMFIITLLKKGTDIRMVARWQGHQDNGEELLRSYADVETEQEREVAKSISLV